MANLNPRNQSGRCSLPIASVAADQDLYALYPPLVAGDVVEGKLPREIIIMGAGNLVYEEEWSGGTVTNTWAVTAAPYTVPLGTVRTIKAATTCTNLLVIW